MLNRERSGNGCCRLNGCFPHCRGCIWAESRSRCTATAFSLDLARLDGAQSFAGWKGDVAVFGEGGVFLGLSCPDWESQELRLHKLFAI